jgi:hypothetical protein
MVSRRISEDLKECALRLWNHGWDVEDICEASGVSRSSCYRVMSLVLPRGELKRIEVEIPRTSKDFDGNEVSRSQFVHTSGLAIFKTALNVVRSAKVILDI